MQYLVIIIPMAMLLWGASGLLGWSGVCVAVCWICAASLLASGFTAAGIALAAIPFAFLFFCYRITR
jgi:hypothetical protein